MKPRLQQGESHQQPLVATTGPTMHREHGGPLTQTGDLHRTLRGLNQPGGLGQTDLNAEHGTTRQLA